MNGSRGQIWKLTLICQVSLLHRVERNLKLNGVEATSTRLLGCSVLDDGGRYHSNDRD
jgi:hypothetical protein